MSTKTLLEEPRAELTALHTLRLLPPSGLIDKVGCSISLITTGNIQEPCVSASIEDADLACSGHAKPVQSLPQAFWSFLCCAQPFLHLLDLHSHS